MFFHTLIKTKYEGQNKEERIRIQKIVIHLLIQAVCKPNATFQLHPSETCKSPRKSLFHLLVETTANWTWDRKVSQAPLKINTQSGKHINVYRIDMMVYCQFVINNVFQTPHQSMHPKAPHRLTRNVWVYSNKFLFQLWLTVIEKQPKL